MTCHLTSVLTVFQEYQDDVRVIVKGFVQWSPVYGWKDFRLQRVLNPGTLDQQAITQPTMLPGLSLPQKKQRVTYKTRGQRNILVST